MLDNYIDNIKDEIIQKTCELIKIPSVYSYSDNPNHPFGENTAKALDYMLNLSKELGFKTKNIDGYCGYIEFGEGKDLVGIIGHLDVVPEGENWTYPPFSATIDNGKIFGRGAIDDKGPVIASLYAMKAVLDTCKVKKRVRLILGIDEERNWGCINYYKEHEEHPTIGFSPDADFPCIYAEKGLLNISLEQSYSSNNSIEITDIDCNNNAINVVPKYCKINLKINSKSIHLNDLINTINSFALENSIEINILSDNEISIISKGIASHAAHPEHGTNAISSLLVILYKTFDKYDIHINILDFFIKYIGYDFNGEKLNLNYTDESGILTINVAQLSLENNNIFLAMNLRIPVTMDSNIVKNKFALSSKEYNLTSEFYGEKAPLYIPKGNELVTKLCNIFNKKTGLNENPIAIGGATYARAFKNCISFGTNMPHNKDMCHQVDEFISIDNLILSSKIYAEAIYELAKE